MIDLDASAFEIDQSSFAPVLQLPVNHGAHRADHAGKHFVGEIIDQGNVEAAVFPVIEVAHDEVCQTGFGIVQGEVAAEVGEGAQLLSQIGQETEIEFGVGANPLARLPGAGGEKLKIINRHQNPVTRSVGEQLQEIENVAGREQKQRDGSPRFLIDAFDADAP